MCSSACYRSSVPQTWRVRFHLQLQVLRRPLLQRPAPLVLPLPPLMGLQNPNQQMGLRLYLLQAPLSRPRRVRQWQRRLPHRHFSATAGIL